MPIEPDTARATQQSPKQVRRADGWHRIEKTPPKYDYEHYSRLAGPLTQPDPSKPYRVQYRSLISQEPHRIRAALMLAAAPLLSLVLLFWLLQPEHWTQRDYPAYDFLPALDIVMLVWIGLIEFFRCMNVLSNAHATLVARDPIPVVPETGTKVAFLTSFVPGKEPLEMVTKTLEAAVKLRHRGLLHIWLLDEGDDPEVKQVCARLGVHHFSRKGVEKWNQPKGPHRTKTKHGNYNAWLDAHGDDYEFFASVDTDHVPLPNYLERMLGFFRDPNVGFVIGPQVYGNYDNFVTKAAESQQFLFHALIQRAGNRYGAPMFVGTSNAVRIRAIKQIGGLYDSITEDMATGFEIHRHKNPATGKKWRSVYTPDVLAVGEGPSAWTDFFTQQMRWARGTYETILKQYWKGWYSLPPSRLFNYTMMIFFYPMSALNWILAALSCALFLGLGASGVNIDPTVWLMLYGNASALQIGLYVWNRRHNVSPHEPEGSGGVAGMVMSALSAPLYAKALIDSVLRRKSEFVVTPKGDSTSPDRWFATFRYHWYFMVIFGASITAGFVYGHSHPVMIIWATYGMLIMATPIFAWRHSTRNEQKNKAAAASGADGATATLSSENQVPGAEPLVRQVPPDADPEKESTARSETAEPHWLVAELAEQAPPGRTVPLHVQVVCASRGRGRGVQLRPFHVPRDGARLLITIHAPGLSVTGDLQQELIVVQGRDSDVLRFELKTTVPGLHQVTVRVFRGGTFLGETHCQISVAHNSVTRDGPQRYAELPTMAFDPGEVTLQVLKDETAGTFSFQLISETFYAPETFHFRAGDPRHATEQIYRELRKAAQAASANASEGEASRLRSRLRNHGVQLWTSVVPQAVQTQFWDQADHVTSFTVLGEHDIVPWELLYPLNEGREDRGFLAEWLPVVRRVFGQDRVRDLSLPGVAFVVPPGSPADTEEEIRALRTRLGPGVRDIGVFTERTALTALIERGHAGLLHFACHNAFTGTGSCVTMSDGPFDPIDLASASQLRTLQPHHPLVFFNACRSAGEIDWFGESLGWAPQFLRAGAGAFIGTLWPVRSDSALRFAESFYDHLITKQLSLSQASLAARHAIRDGHRGDPTWLAYAVYGSPAATAHPVP